MVEGIFKGLYECPGAPLEPALLLKQTYLKGWLMLKKTTSSVIPSVDGKFHTGYVIHDSNSVIQRLLHDACECSRNLTLESSVNGLLSELNGFLEEVEFLVTTRYVLGLLTRVRTLTSFLEEYVSNQAHELVINEQFISRLIELDATLASLVEEDYQSSEIQDIYMMLAWICYFLRDQAASLSHLAIKKWDVTSYYRKAMHRFKLERCIHSNSHRSSHDKSGWPSVAEPYRVTFTGE